MAKSENNEVMYGARGKVGNLVIFKNFANGKTVISKVQRKRENPVYSEDQEIAKERFREGVIYAKGVIEDPILRAFYKPFVKPGSSIYNMALADFCKPPEIKAIDTENYQGATGDVITIRATDNFAIVSLKVFIFKAEGTLIETAAAVKKPNGKDWVYTATISNEAVAGTVVKVQATDTPGNVSELVQPITG